LVVQPRDVLYPQRDCTNTHKLSSTGLRFPFSNIGGWSALLLKMEKQPEYEVDQTHEEASKMAARRGSKANEASDLYGDIQTAEEYGYVSRG
jgi:hypothetical protein